MSESKENESLAARYWAWTEAVSSSSREERLRADRGELSEVTPELMDVMADRDAFDRFLREALELAIGREKILWLYEDVMRKQVDEGDSKLVQRLSELGLPLEAQRVLSEIQRG